MPRISTRRLPSPVAFPRHASAPSKSGPWWRSGHPRRRRQEQPMKYILLIHTDERAFAALSEAERQQIFGEYMQLTQQIRSSGHWLAGAPLHATSSAKSVRIRGGKPIVTDGPFAETREQLGGYVLIEAND